MSDLRGAVDELVTAALADDDAKIRRAVQRALAQVSGAEGPATTAALRALGKGVARAEGRSLQVLLLALGALVEAGASPTAAWPVASHGLEGAFTAARRFAKRYQDRDPDQSLAAAVAKAFPALATTSSKDAAAFASLRARALAAVACLTRSARVRAAARRSKTLLRNVAALTELPEVGMLHQALQVLDGADVTVLVPTQARGLVVRLRDVATNHELLALLTRELAPEAATKKTAKTSKAAGKRKRALVTPFILLPPDALDADGAFRDGITPLSLDDVPAALPTVGKERVVVLAEMTRPARLEAPDPLGGLVPDLGFVKALDEKAMQARLSPRTRTGVGRRRSSSRSRR